MDHTSMLSIQEFAEFTGIRESTLRYYDQIGLLTPVHRGENRYRYYSPFQTIAANFIKVLIRLGVPLSTIKALYKNRTPQDVLALLTQQEYKLDMQLHELQAAYAILHTFRRIIQAGIMTTADDISVQTLDEARFTLGKENDFSNARTFYEPFMQFCNTAAEYNIDLHYPIGGHYADINVFLDTPPQPTHFFSLDPRGNFRRKAGQYLVAHHRGYYGVFGDLPQRLVAYAQANHLAFSGPLYIIYLLNEISVPDASQYLSRLMVGVSKR